MAAGGHRWAVPPTGGARMSGWRGPRRALFAADSVPLAHLLHTASLPEPGQQALRQRSQGERHALLRAAISLQMHQ